MSRVLETVLTGRNLLSPMLASASRDVVAFNSTVAGANEKAAASATASARVQQASATSSAAASGKAATASTVGAGTQSAAAEKIAASNVKASTSASASASTQMRAHTKAAESATLSARVQETANRSLAASNGLLGTSLTPLTAGLSAGALALGYAAYRGMEFDSAMSQVRAASQETGATLDSMRDAAIDAGAKTQYSAVEAAQGITEMSKAGVSARDILAGGLTGALNLAAAGQISVAEAAETGATALSVFRLEGNQMSHVADLLAAGAGKAQGSVGDLSAALNQSALVASQAGLSIEDTTGALAMFASNGLIGSDAGTSFKTMLQALTPNSEKAAKVMADMGLSAFDAGGNFIGLEAYAGKLQTALSGMTEEQRNTTLETIFGSDAVRAASVLYKEGAAGVAQWAGKVNDAGFAARQAADLNDNLRGDLEKLGGAFDSVMTSIGAGEQGALRELVQTLTGLVGVGGDVVGILGAIPGPVYLVLAALAATHLLAGPLTSTVKGVGFAFDVLSASVKNAGGPVAGVKSALSGLASSITPAQVAVFGITMLLPSLIKGIQQLTGASDAAKQAQVSFADALRATNGVVDDSARKAAQHALVEADLVHILDKAGVSSKDAINGLLGQAEAQDRVNRALQDYITANPGTVHNDEATAAMQARNSYEELAKTLGMSQQEAEYFADAAMGAAGATTATGEAAAGAKPAVDGFQQGLQDAADAASAAKQETDLFKLSLDILTGAHVSMLEVESAFQAALAGSKDAMTDLGGAVLDGNNALNMQTENGRKASDVLLGVKDSGNQLIATMIQQGATTDQVIAKDADLRGSFIASARQMGISEEAANRLADEILGIPAERETQIRADIGQAETAIASIQTSIRQLSDKTITITTRTVNENGTVSVRQNRASLGMASGGILHAYASGGIEPMSNRIASVVPANTLRLIGDNVRVPESFIPQDGSASSWAIWRQTGAAMAKLPGFPAAPAAMPGYSTAPAAMPGYGGAVTVTAPPVNIQFLVDGQEFRGMAKAVVDGRFEDWYRKKTYR